MRKFYNPGGSTFNPNQPRDDHGRFASWGDVTPVADTSDAASQKYTVNLLEEEARGGHAISRHVARTDEGLMSDLRGMRIDTGLIIAGREAQGTFSSLESATDYVNRLLQSNTATVDQVSSGAKDYAWIEKRFGSPTGREAFVYDAESLPYIRPTYNVGVLIEHDARSPRGYSVVTAYPRNSYAKD